MRTLTTFGLITAVLAALAAMPARADLRAGAAKADITPNLRAMAPVVQGGFGARNGKPAVGIHDHVYVRALAISDGARRVVIVNMDLTGVPKELYADVVQRVGGDLHLDYGSLIIAPTHTHSSPGNMSRLPQAMAAMYGAYNPKLYELVAAQTERAIREAVHRMGPAEIAIASKQAPGLKRNRRSQLGNTVTDDELTVLYARTPQGEPIGLVVFWTCHATMLGANNLLISGDWPGAMERDIESAMPGVVAMHINGAEGDQTYKFNAPGGFPMAEFYGAEIARNAVTIALAAPAKADATVVTAWAWLTLPAPQVSPAYMDTVAKERKRTLEESQALIRQITVDRVPIAAVRVDGLVIATIPGEAITELGLELKNRAKAAGAEHAVIAGLAGRSIGYILSEKQYNLGGYEASSSYYGPKLGQTVLDGVSALIDRVAPGASAAAQ